MPRPAPSYASRRITHDFENRSAERAGVLNVFVPGGFEVAMPAIVDYFAEQGDADTSSSR